MLRGSRHLVKILGYSFLPIKGSTSRCLDLSRRVGRADIWRRQWELLENRVYNKPNGCSALIANNNNNNNLVTKRIHSDKEKIVLSRRQLH
jgi:hypothetical protein